MGVRSGAVLVGICSSILAPLFVVDSGRPAQATVGSELAWAVPDTVAGLTTSLPVGATAALIDTSTAAAASGAAAETATVIGTVGTAAAVGTAAVWTGVAVGGLGAGYAIGWSGVKSVSFVKDRWFSYHAPEVNSTGFRTAELNGIRLTWTSTEDSWLRYMHFDVVGSRVQTRYDYPRVDVQFARLPCTSNCSEYWADTPDNDGDEVPGHIGFTDLFRSGEPSRYFRLRMQANDSSEVTRWVAISPAGDIGYKLRTEWKCQTPSGAISSVMASESGLFGNMADAPPTFPDGMCVAPGHIVFMRHLVVPVHQVDQISKIVDEWNAPTEYTDTGSDFADCLALASAPCAPTYLDSNGQPWTPDGASRPDSSRWGSHTKPYPPNSPDPLKRVTAEDVALLAGDFAARIYRNGDGTYVAGVEPTEENYKVAARNCIADATFAAAQDPVGRCERSAVFVVGAADAAEPAEHDWQAIFVKRTVFNGQDLPARPDWFSLNYWSNPQLTQGWQNTSLTCSSKTVEQNCDEFPFRRTTQASEAESSLRPLNATQNQLEGSRYGTFATKCLEDSSGTPGPNSEFLMVPLPGMTAVPTFGVCRPQGT